MRTFTLKELEDWVKRRSEYETYQYLNLGSGCLMTKMAKESFYENVFVDSYGRVRPASDFDYRSGDHSINAIGEFPFHRQLWHLIGHFEDATKAEVLAAIKKLRIAEFVAQAKLPSHAL